MTQTTQHIVVETEILHPEQTGTPTSQPEEEGN